MNRKCKKLKPTKRITTSRKSGALTKPQFCRHPIPRRKKTKKLRPTSPPKEVDATEDVTAGPNGTLIRVGSAAVRTSAHVGVSVLKKIRNTAEETRETEKESERT